MTPAKLDRLSWLLYDFANNSFSVMIVTFVYPVYFKSVVTTIPTGWGFLEGPMHRTRRCTRTKDDTISYLASVRRLYCIGPERDSQPG